MCDFRTSIIIVKVIQQFVRFIWKFILSTPPTILTSYKQRIAFAVNSEHQFLFLFILIFGVLITRSILLRSK